MTPRPLSVTMTTRWCLYVAAAGSKVASSQVSLVSRPTLSREVHMGRRGTRQSSFPGPFKKSGLGTRIGTTLISLLEGGAWGWGSYMLLDTKAILLTIFVFRQSLSLCRLQSQWTMQRRLGELLSPALALRCVVIYCVSNDNSVHWTHWYSLYQLYSWCSYVLLFSSYQPLSSQ